MRSNFKLMKKSLSDLRGQLLTFKQRYAEGQKLFLDAVCQYMIEKIQDKAPKINDIEYAKNLKVGYAGRESTSLDSMFIYYEGDGQTLGEDNDAEAAILVEPNPEAPLYLYVLKEYQPWPIDLLPTIILKNEAKVIKRKYSELEVGKLRDRILDQRSVIEGKLHSSGLKGAKIEAGKSKGVGTVVFEDLAFTVLRFEFGIESEQVSHWRPALVDLDKKLDDLKVAFMEYLKTGNDSVFNISNKVDVGQKIDKIKSSEILQRNEFQRKIVKASKLRT